MIYGRNAGGPPAWPSRSMASRGKSTEMPPPGWLGTPRLEIDDVPDDGGDVLSRVISLRARSLALPRERSPRSRRSTISTCARDRPPRLNGKIIPEVEWRWPFPLLPPPSPCAARLLKFMNHATTQDPDLLPSSSLSLSLSLSLSRTIVAAPRRKGNLRKTGVIAGPIGSRIGSAAIRDKYRSRGAIADARDFGAFARPIRRLTCQLGRH